MYSFISSLATYNVQDLLVDASTEWNRAVSIQCVYGLSSTADGCHVIFNDTIDGTVLNVSLPLVQEPTLVTLPAGNYTVTAYDNINGSLYGPAVQYEGISFMIEVVTNIPSPSTTFTISVNGIDTKIFHSLSLTPSGKECLL